MLERLPWPIRRWLYAGGSRSDRLRDPDAVVSALGLRPGMVVGDLGPGVGHFTIRIARAVEPGGIVYALDASQSTLDDLVRAAEVRGLSAVRPVRIPRDRFEVPEPLDLLFVSATYHHLPDPPRYFARAREHLRPGGTVVLLEARREGLLASRYGAHASPPRRVQREMAWAGYRLVTTHDVVHGYWFGVFAPEYRGGMTVRVPRGGRRGLRLPRFAARLGNRMMLRSFRRGGARTQGGIETLLLETVGAKTGQPRQAVLGFLPDGADAWIVIASLAGAARNPAWLHNLAARPEGTVQFEDGRRVEVTAETLEGPALDAAWERLAREAPEFPRYRSKTDRELAIVRLRRR